MNAARRAEVPFSLVPNLERADHASEAEQPQRTGRALDTVMESVPKPTRRELEILQLSANGTPSQAIADALFISKRTVDFHFANLFRKWHVKSRIQALKLARERGLLCS